ncbi:DUF4214 domain-containing protein [Massilia sp. X63]|uniref:DUF4214 domain-containing protein n=1 Tax=Massilia sp. X63 TaxID=3237285 RepID=UPI0034DD075F
MAIVSIKLSQEVVDKEHAMASEAPVPGGDIAGLVDFFAAALDNIDANYAQFSSWKLLDSTLITTYADGAVGTYSGLVLDNATAPRGRASLTGFDFSIPGLLDLGVTGRMIYDYDMSGGGLVFNPAPEGMTINGLRLATRLPTTSPDYDPSFGNVSMSMSGAVTVLPSGEIRGTIGSIDIGADKFIRSASLRGDFSLATIMSNGEPMPMLDGSLKAIDIAYHDGSLVKVSNAAIAFQPGTSLEQALLQGSSGNDDISVDLPGRLYEDMVVAAGSGDDIVTLKGGGGRLGVAAGDGNDVVSLLGDSHVVDGGRGIDTVKLAGAQADYVVKHIAVAPNPDPRYTPVSQYSVTDKSGATSTLTNVERIVFGNATLALDVDGNAGQAYRLYQAAFDRTPDAVGLGFWINSLDKGLSLTDIAAAFLTQAEFKAAYGSSQSNLELVTRFYQNILGREPEAAGRDFWVGKLDDKVVGVAEVLAAISESAENKAGLVDIIGNGFAYTPWGGN